MSFDSQRAWSHLEQIVGFGDRPSGSAAIERTRAYLETELRDLGLEPVRESFRDKTPIGEIEFVNVYVDLPAQSGAATAPLVVLATHFDTKRFDFPFQGANDGGSGTAVLLELARVLSGEDPRPVAYRLLFLDGEEAVRPEWIGKDNCYGSRYHVARASAEGTLTRIRACVLLDMVGDADLRLTYEENSTRALLQLVFDAAEGAGLGRHVGARPQPLKDDHLEFLAAGVPSVDLIDFEYGPANEYWHSPDDVLANCSAQSLATAGQIVLHALPPLERWVHEL
jgi:glutaminyl-peptide cyclotransferase